MKATLITRFKDVTPEGGVIELVVWRVPQPVPPSGHEFKYRAAYVVEVEDFIAAVDATRSRP